MAAYNRCLRAREPWTPRASLGPNGRPLTPRLLLRATDREMAKHHKTMERTKAATRTYLRDGYITKLPCYECATEKDVTFWHPDLLNPLHVVWLCPEHLELWDCAVPAPEVHWGYFESYVKCRPGQVLDVSFTPTHRIYRTKAIREREAREAKGSDLGFQADQARDGALREREIIPSEASERPEAASSTQPPPPVCGGPAVP